MDMLVVWRGWDASRLLDLPILRIGQDRERLWLISFISMTSLLYVRRMPTH